jgi:metal-sulfur cluster biosynthetic enzyme
VCDPELGTDLVSLGLVYGVREEGGVIVVTMTLTTPGCPASESLPAMARMAVERAIPAAEVRVDLVWDPPWSPALITGEAAAALGFTAR